MFCPRCGSEVSPGLVACPSCGTRLKSAQAPAQNFNQPPMQVPVQQPIQPPVQQPMQPPVQQPMQAPMQPPVQPPVQKKKKKSPVKAIIAIVLVIAIVAAGIIFVPKLLNKDKAASANNVFAKTAKSVDKDSDNYNALMVLSALDNTLFETGNYTATVAYESDGYSENAFKLMLDLGKDIPGSEMYLELEDEPVIAIADGRLVVGDGYDCFDIKLDLLNDLQPIINDASEEYATLIREEIRKYNDYGGYYAEYADRLEAELSAIENIRNNSSDIIDTFTSIISDGKINRSFVNEFVEAASALYIPFFNQGLGSEFSLSVDSFDLDTVFDIVAAFVSETDALSVSNDEGIYSIKVNLQRLANNFASFIKTNDEVAKLFPSEFLTNAAEALKDEAYYLDDEEISVKVTTDNGVISKITYTDEYSDSVSLTISNIGETSVGSGYTSKVKDNAYDTTKIDSVSDVEHLINELM